MSQLLLQDVSREIFDRADQSLAAVDRMDRVVDDYFVERLKRDELLHAPEDTRRYEGMRQLFKQEVLPLYQAYQSIVARIRARKDGRRVWHFVAGSVVVFEVLEAGLTRGRSLLPQLAVPTAIFYSLLGFLLYLAVQYFDDRRLAGARGRLERSVRDLDHKLETDLAYDQRRELFGGEVLRGEALEVVARYPSPGEFWRDYRRARLADPTSSSELARLGLPAFERFLQAHLADQSSPVARQQRFNRLFIEAQELFISRDREGYVLSQLAEPQSSSHANL